MAAPSSPEELELYAELARECGPSLDELCARASSILPNVDSEVLLVNWLCHRQNIAPPKFGDRLRSSTPSTAAPTPLPPAPPTRPGSRLDGSETPSLPPRPESRLDGFETPSLPPRPESRAASSRPESRVAPAWPESRAAPSLPENRAASSRPESRLDQGGGWAAPSAATSVAQAPLGREQAEAAISQLPPAATETPPASGLTRPLTLPGLKSLTSIVSNIGTDAQRWKANHDDLKTRRESMRDTIYDAKLQTRATFLAQVLIFRNGVLDENERLQLAMRLEPVVANGGETMMREAEVDSSMFIVERGSFHVYKNYGDVNDGESSSDVSTATLLKGAHFGEESIIYDVPRKTTVVAASGSKSVTLRLSRSSLLDALGPAAVQKLRVAARAELLLSVPVLAWLPFEHAVQVAEKMSALIFHAGATIAGSAGGDSRIYIVQSGCVRVADDSSLGVGAEVRAGEYFGMLGLLSGAALGATATSGYNETVVLSISLAEILATCDRAEDRADLEAGMLAALKTHLMRARLADLQYVEENVFERVRQRTEVVRFPKWSVVMAEGDAFQSMWLLQSGSLVGYKGGLPSLTDAAEAVVPTLECELPGALFGGESLVTKDAHAPFTVVARTDCTMLRVPTDMIRQARQEVHSLLRSVPLFSDGVLPDEQFLAMACKMKSMRIVMGRDIVVESQRGKQLYVILQGHCQAYKTVRGRAQVVKQLGRGELFGEINLVYGTSRTVSVRAVEDVHLLCLSEMDLQDVIGDDMALLSTMRASARLPLLAALPALSGLDEAQRLEICRRMTLESWQPGAKVAAPSEVSPARLVLAGSIDRLGTDPSASASADVRCLGCHNFLYGDCLGFDAVAGDGGAATLALSYNDLIRVAGDVEAQPRLARDFCEAGRRSLLATAAVRSCRGLYDEDVERLVASAKEIEVGNGEAADIVVASPGAMCVVVVERGMVVAEADQLPAKKYFAGDYFVPRPLASAPSRRGVSTNGSVKAATCYRALSDCFLLQMNIEEAVVQAAVQQKNQPARISLHHKRLLELQASVRESSLPVPLS